MVLFNIPRIVYVRIPALKAKKLERLRTLHGLLSQAERQEQELAEGLKNGKLEPHEIRQRLEALEENYVQVRKHAPLEVKPLHFFRRTPAAEYTPDPNEFLDRKAVKRMSENLGPARTLYYAHTRRMDPDILRHLQKGSLRLSWKGLAKAWEKNEARKRQVEASMEDVDRWFEKAKKTDSEYAKWKLERLLDRAEKNMLQVLRQKLLLHRAHADLLQEQIDNTGLPEARTKLAEILPKISETTTELRDAVSGRLDQIWDPEQVTEWTHSARRRQIEQLEEHIRRMGG